MPPDLSIAAHHFEAMGTSCSLFAAGVPDADLVAGEHWTREVAARLTRFDAGSELMRFNASGGSWVEVGEELEQLLHEALRAFDLSAGLVNVAVLPSMAAIGYTRTLRAGTTSVTLEAARPAPRLTDVLEVKPGQARLAAGAGIDLGGIAKGWMADRLCEKLGLNALVNLGGDLRALGAGPAGAGWPVGLAGVTVMLRDHGAATSSALRRRWGGLHHVIDPRTGMPAGGGLAEVSVVAVTAVDAEIVAKTALIAGRDVAPAYCAAHAQAWWLLAG